jgi:hypothetical protein
LRTDNKWTENAIFQSKKYRDARIEAHNALFWMARASHSLLEPTVGNSHLSLFWNEDNHDFRTRLLVDGCKIGLHLPELELYFCDNEKKVPHSFWLDDRTPAFVEAWYLVEFLHRGIEQETFSTALPFESPDMLMGDTEDHNASLFKTELTAMSECLTYAIKILSLVAEQLARHKVFANNPVQITLEPESFTLMSRADLSTANGKTVLVGFSVGDHLRPAPFFFSKACEQVVGSKNHLLDYNPANIITLQSIEDKAISEEELVRNLVHLSSSISFASI